MDDQVRRTILRAMRQPDRYLAAAEVLAARLGATPSQVYRLRLMGWPRVGCWEADVQQRAAAIGADPGLLAELLEELGPR